MRKIIARKGILSFLFIMLELFIFIVYTYFFIIKDIDSEDPMFILDIILFTISFFPPLIFTFMFLIKPMLLIIIEKSNLVLYPDTGFQIIIPLDQVVSASTKISKPKEPFSIVINTKDRGYEVGGITNRKKTVKLINSLLSDYQSKRKFDL